MRLNCLIAMSALVLLSGCSSDKPADQPTKYVNLVGTKVNEGFTDSGNFKSGSKIGVYMTSSSSSLTQNGNHVSNAIFTATESGGFTPTTAFEYPAVPTVDFYAYSPYAASGIDANNKLSFTVPNDQTSLDDADLLWCNSKNNDAVSGAPVKLLFNHKLSKIVINLIAGTGVTLSTPTVVVAGVLPTVKLNVETGVLDNAEGSAASIATAKVTETQVQAIIVPQTVATNTVFITVTNDGKTFTHKLSADKVFASGTSYIYDITINKTSIYVTFTGSINGWTPGDTTPGEAL